MKTIYLHVGTHKTGTTYLQKLLSKNNDVLKKQGFDYLTANCIWDAHHPLGWCFQGVPYDFLSNVCPWINYGVINNLEEEIKQSDCHSFIISSENLYHLKNKDFINRFFSRFKDFDIKPVFYLRNQVSFIESWYYELIRADYYKLTEDFEFFVDNPRYDLDYHQVLAEWSNYVGKDNIIVSSYHDSIKYGLAKHFIGLLGINEVGLILENVVQNERINFAQMAALRIINKLNLSSVAWAEARDMILSDRYLTNLDQLPISDIKTIKKIKKKYKKSNAFLLEEYGVDLL